MAKLKNDEVKQRVESFIEEVNNFSNHKISNTEDIERILGIIFTNDLERKLNDAVFTAKYFQGLTKILKDPGNNLDQDYQDEMKTEYIEVVNSLKSLLKEILSYGTSFISNVYDEKYFQLTQQSLLNLTSLSDDLALIKTYLNSKK
ncbi:MAG: hypothetical protein K9J16_03665 [Melioribacteraceae bacterium]|nr:hypothetical protein [Melioribacteraceae bacterium]MCF8356186.1 hypothetical protein [Melioribacteraceae bacterium]MCF8394757.1 hypothetical protein [Melioribacteraceae bacterium]MCF8417943.1 hypothetical protein [Melioribacteraceae bacterium]